MPNQTSVFLNVNNIEKSIEFYEALGFTTAETYDGEDGKIAYADLDLGGAEISLGHIPANDDPEFRKWVSTPLGAGVIVYVSVPDVDVVYEKAKHHHATIESEPRDQPYGRTFMLNDPDGYTIAFMTEPSE